jgi:RNA polymerase sigma-70 factor, ECF subfamily
LRDDELSGRGLTQVLSWVELRDADDHDLMRQLVAGNDDALAVIVDRYQRLVFSVALRIIKNVGETEDVVQNVFLDIFRKAGNFDPSRGILKVWILQYAYTRSINRRHYLEQRRFYAQTEIDEAESFTSAEEPVRSKQLSPLETVHFVRQALGMLNERQQEAIDLVYFEGLTLAEAAQKTGESLSALRHNYYRGLMKLREVINSERTFAEIAEPELGSGAVRLEVGNLKPRTI